MRRVAVRTNGPTGVSTTRRDVGAGPVAGSGPGRTLGRARTRRSCGLLEARGDGPTGGSRRRPATGRQRAGTLGQGPGVGTEPAGGRRPGGRRGRWHERVGVARAPAWPRSRRSTVRCPGSSSNRARSSAGSEPGSMTSSSRPGAAARARQGPAPGPGHREGGRVSGGQLVGAGEHGGSPRPSGTASGRARRGDQAPGHPSGPGAPMTCWPTTARTASSKPSTAPGTRRPGTARTRGPRAGSAAQHLVDGDGVGVEVEQPPAAAHGRRQVA